MKKLSFLVLIFAMAGLFAAGPEVLLIQKMKVLKERPFAEWQKDQADLMLEINNFFEKRKQLCRGKFSAELLQGKDKLSVTNRPKANKLTWSEQKACLHKVKVIHKDYIRLLFAKRKQFLEKNMSQAIAELAKQKQLALKEADNF